jgi:PAS domain S-box-containing protein
MRSIIPRGYEADFALAFFRESPDGNLIVDPRSLRILSCNPAAIRMTGLPAGEVETRNLRDVVTHADPDAFRQLGETYSRTGSFQSREGFFLPRIGTGKDPLPVNLSLTRIQTNGGDFGIAVLRDTSSAMAQQKLLEAATRAQDIFLDSGDHRAAFEKILHEILKLTRSEYGFIGEVRFSADSKQFLKVHSLTNIAWNQETRDLYDREARNGLEFHNLDTLFGHAMRTGEVVIANDAPNDPRRGGLPSGHPHMACFLGVPFFRQSEMLGLIGLANRPGGYSSHVVDYMKPLLTSCANIVAAFRERLQKERMERALSESESRYRLIAEASADMISLRETNGTILYISPSIATITGYTPEELVGTNGWNTIFPADLDHVLTGIQKLIETFEPMTIEYRKLKKDGTWFWVEAKIRPVLDPKAKVDGKAKVAHLVFCTRDISERKRLEQQFYQAQKMEAVGQLAGGVAHDFNNLLTVINGFSEMLIQDPAMSAVHRESLEEMSKAGQRAAGLTRQLLAFGRRRVMNLAVVNLNEIIRQITALLRRLISAEIEILVELDPGLHLTRLDVHQFEQVIVNLAVNARDAMPHGGRLTLSTRNIEFITTAPGSDLIPGEYVLLEITDNGTGMDPATLARVFEPFFTTKDVGKGTGLGLASAYGIVRQSDGQITVESELHVGTTFRIYLPRVSAEGEVVEPPKRPSPLPKGRETILIAEDDEAVRRLTVMAIRAAGYRVLEARNGFDAIRLFDAQSDGIELLLTDAIMPGMRGIDLANRLRQTKPNLKVLIVSGYTDQELANRGSPNSNTFFLGKPFTPTELLGMVRHLLDASKASKGDV